MSELLRSGGGERLTPLRNRLMRRRVLRLLIPAAALLALVCGFVVFAPGAFAREATVVRVVDGDTVDVMLDGGVTRIRILNIDTPETVDPSQGEECLGSEATELTRSLLPTGAKVNLEYDEVREDNYGRTLAHIELSDGRLVSTELAKAGLGAPMVVGANDARVAEVEEGLQAAVAEQRGFFDPEEQCTFAAQAAGMESATQSAAAVSAGSSIPTAVAAAASVLAIAETYDDLRRVLASGTSFGVKMFQVAGLGAAVVRVQAGLDRIESHYQTLNRIAEDRITAQEVLREKRLAKIKAARLAAKKAAAKKAAAAEAAREAADLAAGQYDDHYDEPNVSPDPYAGYTGPRCYAPGGKTWTPC